MRLLAIATLIAFGASPVSAADKNEDKAKEAAVAFLKAVKSKDVDAVLKTRETPGLKGVKDPEERRELLDGAVTVDQAKVKGQGVLLVDDLYRSGATANAVSVALLSAGAARVYFLAATRTRSNV